MNSPNIERELGAIIDEAKAWEKEVEAELQGLVDYLHFQSGETAYVAYKKISDLLASIRAKGAKQP
jgi:hypothetical protein